MLSKELLERFKRGEVVFHTPTQEIFDKAVEAVKSVGCEWRSGVGNFCERKEFTCIDNEDTNGMTYCNRSYYEEYYPQLEIITLRLSDFDSEPQVISQGTKAPITRSQAELADIQERLMEITRAIAYCRKLEETYDTDLELDGLYTAREEILRELEDSLEVHL